jgi:hypothetical protein
MIHDLAISALVGIGVAVLVVLAVELLMRWWRGK